MDSFLVAVAVIGSIFSALMLGGIAIDSDQRRMRFGYALHSFTIIAPIVVAVWLWLCIGFNSWQSVGHWSRIVDIQRSGEAVYAVDGDRVIALDGNDRFVDVGKFALKVYGREAAWHCGILFSSVRYHKIVSKEVELK